MAASVAPVLVHVKVTDTGSLSFLHPTELLFAGLNEVKTGPVEVGGALGLGGVVGLALALGVALGVGLTVVLGVGLAVSVASGELLAVGLEPRSAPEKISVRSTTTAIRSRPPMIARIRTSFFERGAFSPDGAGAVGISKRSVGVSSLMSSCFGQ